MKCNFCINHDAIITSETCCTGCSRLTIESIKNMSKKEMKESLERTENKIIDKLQKQTSTDVEIPFEAKEFIKHNEEKPAQVDKDYDAIIDLLKLIQEHLKAIERNTFKGY